MYEYTSFRVYEYTSFRVYECVQHDHARMCGPVCLSYRSGKINSLYGYKYKHISICLLTANKVALFSFSFLLYIITGAAC